MGVAVGMGLGVAVGAGLGVAVGISAGVAVGMGDGAIVGDGVAVGLGATVGIGAGGDVGVAAVVSPDAGAGVSAGSDSSDVQANTASMSIIKMLMQILNVLLQESRGFSERTHHITSSSDYVMIYSRIDIIIVIYQGETGETAGTRKSKHGGK